MKKIYIFHFEGEATGNRHHPTILGATIEVIKLQFDVSVAFFDGDFMEKGPEKKIQIEKALYEVFREKSIDNIKIFQTDKIHFIESVFIAL